MTNNNDRRGHNAVKGKQGFQEVAKDAPDRTALPHKVAGIEALLPEGYELTEQRLRIINSLTNPDPVSSLAFYGEGVLDDEWDSIPDDDLDGQRCRIAAGLNAEFPTSSWNLEGSDMQNVVDALNEDDRDIHLFNSISEDEDGLIMDVGVWLEDSTYLTTPINAKYVLPDFEAGEGRGFAAAILVAEQIEMGHERMVARAKQFGLMTPEGKSVLAWDYQPPADEATHQTG